MFGIKSVFNLSLKEESQVW
ncbi:hypothetical protein F383_26100 [Gossypium arboreum]|uniref:Uncharacterized protein n=1 Tax=Gossypium arboreum TaxID=29729 RepID=A0A0B0P9K3_GOSAR|nr:hypothetical protein F383_26100 [Gossypium arboreum]